MPTGNAIQTATVVSGGGGGTAGTATVALALADSTGTVNVSAGLAPGAAGSVLTSQGGTSAIWSTTTGTTGSAGFATNSGTATTSGFATNAGTATVSGFATNAGTSTVSGFATNAGTATVSGTATIANALTDATGTVNVSGATAPGAAGSVLISSSANTATWGIDQGAAFATNAGTATIAGFATNAGTATVSTTAGFATNAGTASVGTRYQINTGTAPIGTGTLVTDLGPDFTVTANSIGSGTTLQAQCWVAFGNIGAAGSGTVGVYWNGIAGTLLCSQVINATDLANDAYQFSVSMLAISASVVQVAFYGFGLTSTTYTGFNSTSASNALTFGIHWNFNGSGTVTPVSAYGYPTVT